MGYKIEAYEDKGGEWRWRFCHENGNIIAASSEGYSDRKGCMASIKSVQLNAANAPVSVVKDAGDEPKPEPETSKEESKGDDGNPEGEPKEDDEGNEGDTEGSKKTGRKGSKKGTKKKRK